MIFLQEETAWKIRWIERMTKIQIPPRLRRDAFMVCGYRDLRNTARSSSYQNCIYMASFEQTDVKFVKNNPPMGLRSDFRLGIIQT